MNDGPAIHTTGLPGLDAVLKGVKPGDNIVWQVDTISDYRALVLPYVQAALQNRRRLVYFRFASHPPLLEDLDGIEVHTLDPDIGFELFVTAVHAVIEQAGRGVVYVFDCLSELAAIWQADQMLGNFFVLTCPRLYDLETVTYFAIYRYTHACYALDPITDTTQFLLDIFRHQGKLYVRPIKVQHRSSSSMNTLHRWEGEHFKPITASPLISDILAMSRWPGLRQDPRRGTWRRIFDEAEAVYQSARVGECSPERVRAIFDRLSRMVFSRDEKILGLIRTYLSLEDILAVRDRMVGIGLIGGKAVGMLLARAILQRNDTRFAELLETHDSFFIGADVFYTFLVRNGLWWLRRRQLDPSTFLDGLDEVRTRVLKGDFPDYTLQQFRAMLDYFGESPYIVRSSSLLEDNYGNAFAGKYESVFCVNQGSRAERLAALLDGIRTVYLSAMSEPALLYRKHRGLLDRDEQMALLVMRVSGERYGEKYFPQVAGVGFSYNPYVWHRRINPRAGVARLVFGLGTRAVDRSDDDYTRIVALNAPEIRPESNFDAVCEVAQRRVDFLDLHENRLISGMFNDLAAALPELPLHVFASPDPAVDRNLPTHWVLTFDRLLRHTRFVKDLRRMLEILEAAYAHPVDIEFTANYVDAEQYRINLLQCRPLQVQGADAGEMPSFRIVPNRRILEAHGAVIGQSRVLDIDTLIYVRPDRYAELPVHQRAEVARVIGVLNRNCPAGRAVMLLGPGRWGTSSPELGIPVRFAEINRITVLCELVMMRENLVPDVSLGTHFLSEIVEQNILYLAFFPQHKRDFLRESFFLDTPNRMTEWAPSFAEWADLLRVVEIPRANDPHERLILTANAMEQVVQMFFMDEPIPSGPGNGPASPATKGKRDVHGNVARATDR